jgi:leucyl/phenylalanyl-tRNA--protein transferase
MPFYPLPEWAERLGLVAVGGDLRPGRLLAAYRNGVFPWYSEGDPIHWWSPDPRAVFELDGLRVSRRLRRTVRSGRFRVTFDRDFAGVIRGCADRPGEGTWLTAEMIEAYEELHRLGHAHSVEVWYRASWEEYVEAHHQLGHAPGGDDRPGGRLAGGVYGVAVGGLFAGESMFTRVRDASKVALVHLVERLRRRGFRLFDIQFVTDHTARLGAVTIPRAEYLKRLEEAVACPVTFI